jgi:LAO/AO transport system kinase
MNELSKHPRAFVRACPTGGVLGGVARYTNDVVLLCQSADFDVVFIETVGLGQSEIMIDEASDMLLLLVPPGGGDELQGVKKGIMEVGRICQRPASPRSNVYLMLIVMLGSGGRHYSCEQG